MRKEDPVSRKAAVLVSILFIMSAACGGGGSSSSSTPTTPTTPTPPAPTNRAPVINSLNFAPSFGIAGLTRFEFNASASDPDGDAVSYAWDVAGNAFTGTNGSVTFINPFDGVARVTVTDSKGATASDTRSFVVGSMTGSWLITSGPLVGASFNLTQGATGLVSGSFALPGIGNGNTDPAEPGRMNAAAQLAMRVKIGRFTDFNMNGTMDSTGRVVSGSLQGSGFTGQPFTMRK